MSFKQVNDLNIRVKAKAKELNTQKKYSGFVALDLSPLFTVTPQTQVTKIKTDK